MRARFVVLALWLMGLSGCSESRTVEGLVRDSALLPTEGPHTSVTVNAALDHSMTFRVSQTGTLYRVDLWARSSRLDSDIDVWLRPTVNGFPTNDDDQVLARTSFRVKQRHLEGDWIRCFFGIEGPELIADQSYALCFRVRSREDGQAARFPNVSFQGIEAEVYAPSRTFFRDPDPESTARPTKWTELARENFQRIYIIPE